MNFIGLSYLLVYIGAVSILFLFILMLINIRISELLHETSNSIPLAIIIGISFNYSVYQVLPYSFTSFDINNVLNAHFYNNINNITSKLFNDSISNDIFYVTSKL
jgi:NADH-ubiquinone oxidoreductase chain 6